MLHYRFPKLEECTGIPKIFNSELSIGEDTAAISDWLSKMISKMPYVPNDEDLEKLWQEHRTHRALELVAISEIGILISSVVSQALGREFQFSGRLGTWADDMHGIDGYIEFPGGINVPVDVTFSQQKITKPRTLIERAVIYTQGDRIMALAGKSEIDLSKKGGGGKTVSEKAKTLVDSIIAFRNHNRDGRLIHTAVIGNNASAFANLVAEILNQNPLWQKTPAWKQVQKSLSPSRR